MVHDSANARLAVEGVVMKKAIAILLFMAASTSANDRCPEDTKVCMPAGPVRNWCDVQRARYEASLCSAEMTGVAYREQLNLIYRNPAVTFQPYYSSRPAISPTPTSATSIPMIPLVPATNLAPPMPPVPAASEIVSPPTSLPVPLPGRPR
jgi:hypothetical protein